MAITTEALERLGIHLPPDVVETMVLEAMEQVLSGERLMDPRKELSVAESTALVNGGFDLEQIDHGTDDPLARTAAEYAALVATSLSVADAAKTLQVAESRVRRRLAARTLYGIKLQSGWKVPRFQFDQDHLLPGLEVVLPSVPRSLHPLAV